MLTLLTALALAAPPPVAWQGRLLDADGAPISGDHALTWRLYTAPTGGSPVWTESATVGVSGGYASALLGASAANPLPAAALDGQAAWVELLVDGTALGARERVGGALAAGIADRLAHPGYIYASTAEATADGLLAYVDFDAPNGCEGAALADRMGYLAGVCTGAGTRAPGAVGMAIDRGTGVQHGFLFTFPNGDSYGTFTASLWWHPTDMTIYASADGAGILWLSDRSGESLVGFFDHTGNDRMTWGHWPNSSHTSSGLLRATDFQLRQGHWHHLVVTRDAGANLARLYVNGQIVDQWPGKVLQLGPKAAVANYHWLTAGNSNAHYGRGWADELVLWERALSPAEVAGLYAQQRAGRQVVP